MCVWCVGWKTGAGWRMFVMIRLLVRRSVMRRVDAMREAVVVIDKIVLKVWGPDVSVVIPLYCMVASLILIWYEEVNRHLDRYHRLS